MTAKFDHPVVRRVRLSGIACLPQRRAVRPEAVDALARSMGDVGLINPITLRPKPGLGFYLIAGQHRYEAALKLKWKSIPAIVLKDIDALDAELREIDENLIRADLSPAEQAAHHARRKELYEQRHPQTKRGGKPGAGRGQGKKKIEEPQNADVASYAEDAANKTGKSRDTVERAVRRGKDIPGVADHAGTSLDKCEELDALAKLGGIAPERQVELIEKAKSGEKVSAKAEVKKVHRDTREAELGAKQLALPSRQFGAILEDYEWDDEGWSPGTGMDRHAANPHYPTSKAARSAEEIVAATQDRFACAAPDCVLFMWTTIHALAIALEVMKLRGFEYKSHYIWAKPNISLGRWTRAKHEILLIGTRGHVPCPAPGTQWDSLVLAPHAGPHSAKPDRFAEMIEAYYPTLPKIELNARRARPGWTAWGLDAPAAEDTPASAAQSITSVAESLGVDAIAATPAAPARGAADDGLGIPDFLKRNTAVVTTPPSPAE